MSSASSSAALSLDVASIYRDHFDYVATNLRRLGVPPAAIEDACHDVFLVVYRRARAWGSARDAMRPWLYGVARRVAADVRRSGMRHRRRVVALQSVPRHDAAVDQVVADRTLVHDFLAALNVDQRDVFILIELEEMTAREAGDVLGINPNTAAARLRAARRSFAEQLAANATLADEARILAAARQPEVADEATRTRVWIGLVPLVGPTSGLSTLLVAMVGSALLVATTATFAGVGESEAAASPVVARSFADDEDATRTERAPAVIEPAIVPATLAPPLPPDTTPTHVDRDSIDEGTTTRARRIADAPPSTPASEPVIAADPATADELRAQNELAGRVLRASDPETILRLVDEYRTRFAGGFFADRLSARRIEALCTSDRVELATVEHTALAQRQPALARRAFTRCDAGSDHENEAARPTDG